MWRKVEPTTSEILVTSVGDSGHETALVNETSLIGDKSMRITTDYEEETNQFRRVLDAITNSFERLDISYSNRSIRVHSSSSSPATGESESTSSGSSVDGSDAEESEHSVDSDDPDRLISTMTEGKLRQSPVFRGRPDEDPSDWLERFNEIADDNKWNSAMKLKNVRLLLDETARRWPLCQPVKT